MARIRVIPVLLVQNGGLVKTSKFSNPVYVGDPINAVRIFNEKEVDEIVVLDISATERKKRPDMKMIADIASECFMPLCYGGGITHVDEIKEILAIGVEKVAINTAALTNLDLISEASRLVGSQSIVVSVDVKRKILGGYRVYTERGRRDTGRDPVEWAVEIERAGGGEILLTSIDREGTYNGYDLDLIQRVSERISIPVIGSGGASSVEDLSAAIQAGASAVSAGSLFVFHGRHRAVLINFPTQTELKEKLYSLRLHAR